MFDNNIFAPLTTDWALLFVFAPKKTVNYYALMIVEKKMRS